MHAYHINSVWPYGLQHGNHLIMLNFQSGLVVLVSIGNGYMHTIRILRSKLSTRKLVRTL